MRGSCELRQLIWQDPKIYKNEHGMAPRNYNPPLEIINEIESLFKQGISRDEIPVQTIFPEHFSKKKIQTILEKCEIRVENTPIVIKMAKKKHTLAEIHDKIHNETNLSIIDIAHIIHTNLSDEEYNLLQSTKLKEKFSTNIYNLIPIVEPYLKEFRSLEYIAEKSELGKRLVCRTVKKILKEDFDIYKQKINAIGHLKLKYPVIECLEKMDAMIAQHYVRVQIMDILSLTFLSFKALYELRKGYDYKKYIDIINPDNEIYQNHYKKFQYIYDEYPKICKTKIAQNLGTKVETMNKILKSNVFKEFVIKSHCENCLKNRVNLDNLNTVEIKQEQEIVTMIMKKSFESHKIIKRKFKKEIINKNKEIKVYIKHHSKFDFISQNIKDIPTSRICEFLNIDVYNLNKILNSSQYKKFIERKRNNNFLKINKIDLVKLPRSSRASKYVYSARGERNQNEAVFPLIRQYSDYIAQFIDTINNLIATNADQKSIDSLINQLLNMPNLDPRDREYIITTYKSKK